MVAFLAATDHLFLRLALNVFKNTVPETATLAIKLVALLAIILRILECELAFTAFAPLTMCLISALLDKLFDFRVRRKIHGFVAAVVGNIEIDTCGHEQFHDS